MNDTATLTDAVRDALRGVIDPEMGIDVVDLGLVYGIAVDDDRAVSVRLTVTSPACPLGEFMRATAEDAIRAAVPDATGVAVTLVLDPPWAPERISAAARRRLGWPEA
ncbi:metal-sulfur cluster assembly factor [Azospirillum halopraeferens]|uniref:metal-sulfur cluster assembly factor n=1 Tax=Azospirillum halopraeferens TaxID=34010 RepID=UPI0004104379|nr:metal-sulfur cluster assembly factor [Azospirillum halopraeferens]